MPREVKWLAYVGVERPKAESGLSQTKEHKSKVNLWLRANDTAYRQQVNARTRKYQKLRMQRDPEYKKYLYALVRDGASALGYRRDRSGRKKMDNVPDWLTEEHLRQMRAVYRHARLLTKETGVAHTVDHIWPIYGTNASDEYISCGLHVPWNLQILTAKQNSSKGRRNPVED
jgi:5-methylcytosine-specific restriction endonuclease McrA